MLSCNLENKMRKISILLLLIGTCVLVLSAQASKEVCRLGISYDISTNKKWGFGMPVVTKVYPYSPAENAGVKRNDIILKVDDISVGEMTGDVLPQMLNPYDKNKVKLTLRNFNYEERDVIVTKECIPLNTIKEEQLATAFSMYSLENTVERTFICPFKTTVTEDTVDFINYRTFAFPEIEEGNEELENAINMIIRSDLEAKGMRYDENAPNLVIQTFYFFDKNPKFRGVSKVRTKSDQVFRYDGSVQKIVKLPFMTSVSESEAEYILQFGIRFIDTATGASIWESEAEELMYEPFDLAKYAQIHIPLMCMQYPRVSHTKNVSFKVGFKTYNYTGLNYDIDRLSLVKKVDLNSPAAEAGIRVGDLIENIEGKELMRSADEYTAAYKQFISNSMKFRDAETVFTDSNGFERCMYWSTLNYPQIEKMLNKPEYLPVFSYLYKFAPYVDLSGSNTLKMQVHRSNEKFEVVLRPVIRTAPTIDIN